MTRLFEWFAINPWATALLMVLFIAVSTLMVLAILIQRPQGGGLSAAFGGSSGGSGQTAFGTKTGDALTWFTISVFAAFLLFGIILNYATTPVPRSVEPTSATAPAETAPTDQPASGAATPAPVTPPTTDGTSATPVTAPATAVPAATPAAPSATPSTVPPAASPAPSSATPAPASTPSPTPAPKPENPAPKN